MISRRGLFAIFLTPLLSGGKKSKKPKKQRSIFTEFDARTATWVDITPYQKDPPMWMLEQVCCDCNLTHEEMFYCYKNEDDGLVHLKAGFCRDEDETQRRRRRDPRFRNVKDPFIDSFIENRWEEMRRR